jgi:plastocyanin
MATIARLTRPVFLDVRHARASEYTEAKFMVYLRKEWWRSMRRFFVLSTIGMVTAAASAAETRAQATTSVSGQVTIVERPGEVTEDLGNTVVYLEPISTASRARPAATKTVIALQSRQFSPRVRVVTEGGRIEFPNQDPFNHNVFSKTNGGFDTGVYGRGKVREQTFAIPGVYTLYCNVHPRMTAFVITLQTPYYTQAGADGRFFLDSVPPGRYKLHVWHDRVTESVTELTVPATGLRNHRASLNATGYKYVQHKNKFGQVYASTGGDRY